MITESTARKLGEIDIVDISGRLSLGNALLSIEKSILNMIEQGSRRMVVNLPALIAIDSAGVGMLLGCGGQMELHQGRLRIAGAQGGVARTFDIVHMERVVPLDADLETACRVLE